MLENIFMLIVLGSFFLTVYLLVKIIINRVKKENNPKYKKMSIISLATLVIGFIGFGIFSEETKAPIIEKKQNLVFTKKEDVEEKVSKEIENQPKKEEPKKEGPKKPEPKKEGPKKPEPKKEQTKKKEEKKIPREHKNALGKAGDYLDFKAFSKKGLGEQLKYEGFPPDAIEYALKNIKVDWKKEALRMAKAYLDFQSFSDKGLYDQLIFEGFSVEQAQYAISNLD